MLVNNATLNAFGRPGGLGGPNLASGLGEFPSVNFSIDPGTEFGDMGLDGPAGVSSDNNGRSFADLLHDAIDGVSHQDRKAVQVGLDFALGKDIDPHQVTIEQAKAESQIHLMSAITTKMASSYQTLMNMQI